MESRKMVMMNVFAEQQWRHRHREQICQHGGGGEDGMDWESSAETYVLSYVKWIASRNLLCDAELKPGALWQCREVGWGGREVQKGGNIYVPMVVHMDIWQKPTQHCKAIIL